MPKGRPQIQNRQKFTMQGVHSSFIKMVDSQQFIDQRGILVYLAQCQSSHDDLKNFIIDSIPLDDVIPDTGAGEDMTTYAKVRRQRVYCPFTIANPIRRVLSIALIGGDKKLTPFSIQTMNDFREAQQLIQSRCGSMFSWQHAAEQRSPQYGKIYVDYSASPITKECVTKIITPYCMESQLEPHEKYINVRYSQVI